MSAPNIILNKPKVLLYQTTTTNFSIVVQDTECIYGVIEKIYQTADYYAVQDLVFFDPKNAIRFTYSSTSYFLIDEKDIIWNEGQYAPP